VSRPGLVPTQSPIQLLPVAVPPGVKRQGLEADHSPPSSAEVKNGGAIRPLLHTCPWRDDCTGADLPSFISASVLVCFHNPPKYSSDLISDSCVFSQPDCKV
jgi:hypothetical protein